MKWYFQLIIIAVFSSCYTGRKINKNISVKIVQNFNVEKINRSSSTNYLDYADELKYKETFLSSLFNEAGYSTNVMLINDDSSKADFELIVTFVTVVESQSIETVNDNSSPYNGQQYYLTSIDVNADFDITDGKSKLGSYKAQASKTEKLTNNRSLGQMIIGANKDNSIYREKLLQDDVCVDLAGKCGRRTWNLFTQKLSKKIK